MLETIREFAWAQLEEGGEAAAARSRHAIAFTELVEAARPELTGPHQAEWLRRFDAEHGNLRAALAWALEQGGELGGVGLRLAAGLWQFWMSRGLLTEGVTWLERALATSAAVPIAVRATALKGQGNLMVDLNDLAGACERYEASLRLFRAAGEQQGVAGVLNNLGLIAVLRGDLRLARRHFEESIRVAHETGERALVSLTLCNLGEIEIAEGRFDAAERLGDAAYALSTEIGNTRAIAYSCEHRGLLAYHRGEDAAALRWYEAGLSHARDLGDLPTYAHILQYMSRVLVRQGRVAPAARLVGEALTIRQEMRSRRVVAECLDTMADVGQAGRRPATAARLIGAAATVRVRLQETIPPTRRAAHEACVAGLRATLGDAPFQAELRAGREMATDEAMVVALRLAEELGREWPAAKVIPTAVTDRAIDQVVEPVTIERLDGGMAKA
jgi:non-specific serine/threonine protein kinase